MNKECEIVRDLLPLYVDDVCSESSRDIVETHLKECADCAAYLEQIRSDEAEEDLKEEKGLVIQRQAKRFRRRSAVAGSIVSGIFMVPILVCLIVNLVSGRTLDWFFVVLAGMLVAASLVVVPLMASESKLFWTFCAFTVSLVVLLAVCFALGYVLTTTYSSINAIMFIVFALVGLAWAAINVNSLPMVVEMCKGSDIGKFTGYYYTASMAAQIVTPILAGTLMRNISYKILFPYAALFVALSFLTMTQVHHGDNRPEAKKGLQAFEEMDD